MCLPASELANLATVLAVCLCLGLHIFVFHWLLGPFARLFHCSDPSIAFPYRQETISLPLTVGIGLLLLLGSVLVVETARHLSGMNRLYRRDADYAHCLPCEAALAATAATCARALLLAAFGWLLTEALGSTLRSIVGWHRPHFLEVCRPNASVCNNGARPISIGHCQPISNQQLLQSVRGFPSAHAAHSAYAATFCCMYLQSRFTFARGHAAKWLLQAMSLAWCVGVAASRVSDYWQPPASAVAGCLLGAAVAALVGLRLRPSCVNCFCSPTAFDEEALAVAAGRRRSEDRQRQLQVPGWQVREEHDGGGRYNRSDAPTEMVNMSSA